VTDLLDKAFRKAAELPAEEQDRLAALILADLQSEARWEQAFAGTEDELARLADAALTEAEAGRTQPLVPDSL